MKDFFSLVENRESCRSFSGAPVEREKLEKIIETAHLSPSACNSQPWSFTVVDSSPLSGEVALTLQDNGLNKFTSDCPAFIVITEEHANLSAKLGGRFKDQQFASIDIGLCTAHICYSAAALGLSTCVIGWINEQKLKKLVDIPDAKRIRLVVCVGYEKSDARRTRSRKPLDSIVRYL